MSIRQQTICCRPTQEDNQNRIACLATVVRPLIQISAYIYLSHFTGKTTTCIWLWTYSSCRFFLFCRLNGIFFMNYTRSKRMRGAVRLPLNAAVVGVHWTRELALYINLHLYIHGQAAIKPLKNKTFTFCFRQLRTLTHEVESSAWECRSSRLTAWAGQSIYSVFSTQTNTYTAGSSVSWHHIAPLFSAATTSSAGSERNPELMFAMANELSFRF